MESQPPPHRTIRAPSPALRSPQLKPILETSAKQAPPHNLGLFCFLTLDAPGPPLAFDVPLGSVVANPFRPDHPFRPPAYTGPAGFIQSEDCVQGLDSASYKLIVRLELTRRVLDEEETVVADFAVHVLRALDYETELAWVCSQKRIRLYTCGDFTFGKAGACVLGAASEILLIVQDEKPHVNPAPDPEAQLIAEAIGVFQENNRKRADELFQKPLEAAIIPGITMTGTFPRFYKIKVTTDLDRCVRHGEYPSTATIVYRYTPSVPQGRSEGMKPLGNRKVLLHCFEAFKQFVFPRLENSQN